jgi:hypothetical protein
MHYNFPKKLSSTFQKIQAIDYYHFKYHYIDKHKVPTAAFSKDKIISNEWES